MEFNPLFDCLPFLSKLLPKKQNMNIIMGNQSWSSFCGPSKTLPYHLVTESIKKCENASLNPGITWRHAYFSHIRLKLILSSYIFITIYDFVLKYEDKKVWHHNGKHSMNSVRILIKGPQGCCSEIRQSYMLFIDLVVSKCGKRWEFNP